MKGLRRLSGKSASRLAEPYLSVAPLIDICFLLIAFFIVTTTILPQERDIRTEGATTITPPSHPAHPVMVLVRADGAVVLHPGGNEIVVSGDRQEHDLPVLRGFLESAMVGARELPQLLVQAEGMANHQRVVDVMNVCARVGWTRVGFLDLLDHQGDRVVRDHAGGRE